MIYFYAGLGAAMLTGIMLLFEIGLALTGQSFLPGSQKVEGYRDVVNQSERLFLKMLSDSQDLKAIGTGRSGNLLCRQILCRINGIGCSFGNSKNSLYERTSLKDYEIAKIPSADLYPWSYSCALERKMPDTGYINRILIKPSQYGLESGYELYGCIVENQKDFRCSFERRG